jgi:hypothetical protein
LTTTANDLTREHYQRPEVKGTILRYCLDGEAFRALNGDQGWYTSANDGKVRLRTPGDYEDTITRFRTLYATLDLLDPSVKQASGVWDDTKHAPTEPIGTLRDCAAYTLGVDIDGVGDIQDPEVKGAVEGAARFLVDALNAAGITKSVHCLYSGGGIYVFVHHGLFRASSEWSPEDREQAFRSLTMAFNGLIEEISQKFFEAHPGHSGKAKFDALNNQKRKFKTIFSIHKRLPFAVIPLDPQHIEINFDKARLPISAEVLGEGERWYQSYDPEELPRLKELLQPYVEQVAEVLQERGVRTRNHEIPRFPKPLPLEKWPPCMRNILEKAEPGKGPHRALAVLAAYLYQAGWPEEEAFKLWVPIAERAGVEARIFYCWFGQMRCPSCQTIRKRSAGYPRVGLGELGYCEGVCR